MIDGHAVLLQIALHNRIENALQHTSGGTRIDVTVRPQPPTLEVTDDGPSTPPGGASAHAGLGLGLGHQVVQRIAAVHDARFDRLEQAERGRRIYRIVIDPAEQARRRPAEPPRPRCWPGARRQTRLTATSATTVASTTQAVARQAMFDVRRKVSCSRPSQNGVIAPARRLISSCVQRDRNSPGNFLSFLNAKPYQTQRRCRSMQVSSTSPPSRRHQFVLEKISTSL